MKARVHSNPESLIEPQPTEDMPNTIATRGRTRLSWKSVLLEWSLLIFAVLVFCMGILDLGEQTRLPGNETETFQMLDWTLVNSLTYNRTFPIWNPYLRTGMPFVADPMSHVFNPVSTIPVLLFGVGDGFKIGVTISYLIAALGMWWLGAILGLGRMSRLWIALMYVFAGQPVARFFQGQYLFVLGFPWIPLVVGCLFRLMDTRRWIYAASAAIFLALLFFSGNVYFTFYIIVTILIFLLVTQLRVTRKKPFILIEKKSVSMVVTAGLLTIGLISIQFLPLIEFWPVIDKSTDPVGSHTLQQILLDYTSKDTMRSDAYAALPAREEFYAYIGVTPFLALLLLPLAFQVKGNRKPILIFSMIFIFAVFWISVEFMPWYQTFTEIKFLSQFRHLLRILIFGSFALIILAGMGLDSLWRLLLSHKSSQAHSTSERARNYAVTIGLAILSIYMMAGTLDLFHTNRQHVQSQDIHTPIYQVMQWLRKYDESDFYVRINPNNASQDAPLAANIRFIDAWYHFGDIRQVDPAVNNRPVQARPHYVVQHSSAPPLNSPEAVPIAQVQGYEVFQLPHSLPYIFRVKDEVLFAESQTSELQRHDVIPISASSSTPNTIEITATTGEDQTLVVLTTHYPGWGVTIDGDEHIVQNIGGYLAVEMLAGEHKYIFSYRPRTFYAGLILSLVSLGATLFLLTKDIQPRQWHLSAWVGTLPEIWERTKDGFKQRFYAGRVIAQATYRNGVLQPSEILELDNDTVVKVSVESISKGKIHLNMILKKWLWGTTDLFIGLAQVISLGTLLFILSLSVYTITRLWALDRFPIYYFGDEAIQTLFAENLIKQKFISLDGTPLPIYVEAAGNRWTPLLSMYFHALTSSLFGKSIFVSRGTSAVISILGAASVGLILKKIFKARFWWTGALLVGLTPAWFLHSRTAFETVMTTAFYGCFLLFYLLYRYKSPRYLYGAVALGAATFYTYSNAQAIVIAAAVMLFISDFRYHLQHRPILLRAFLLAILFALPLISFRLNKPEAMSDHLRVVGSYLFQPLPLIDKIQIYIQKFAYGLSPQYWFFPNEHDLPRHRMAGFGHIHITVLPLFVIGLVLCFRHIKSSAHRTVLIAALATPVGAAMVDIGIARLLAFIIPANILAGLGLEWILTRLESRIPYKAIALTVFILLTWANFAILLTALKDGPLWFRDYGLYGMQYGAKQLFEEAIPEYLQNEEDAQILVSSTWANGADNFIRFFFTPEEQKRVRMGGIRTYLFEKLPLGDQQVFVLTPDEYEEAVSNPKIGSVEVEQIIPYPDGSPGFYFARIGYSKIADDIFATEKEARRQLVVDYVNYEGEKVELRYSQIDMGVPALMFDNDPFTLIRGLEANPFILELVFDEPRPIHGIIADFGKVGISVTATLHGVSGEDVFIYNEIFPKPTDETTVEMYFNDAPGTVYKIHLEILNPQSGEKANIHIREFKLLP